MGANASEGYINEGQQRPPTHSLILKYALLRTVSGPGRIVGTLSTAVCGRVQQNMCDADMRTLDSMIFVNKQTLNSGNSHVRSTSVPFLSIITYDPV